MILIILKRIYHLYFITACAFGVGGMAFGFLLKVMGGHLMDVSSIKILKYAKTANNIKA